MRASSLLRIVLVLSMLASISVAGTAVAWRAGERILAAAAGDAAADELLPVQAGELEKQLRSYRVRLSADGRLPGRINVVDPVTGLVSPARDMKIALLQNGQVVTEFQPGIDGIFQAEGVQPGAYSLVGHGEEGYIAYGLEVMPAEFNVDNRDGGDIHQVAFQEIEAELQIDSLAIPPTDGPSVLSLATEHLPPEIVAAAREIAANAQAAPQPPPAGGLADLDPSEVDPLAEATPAANLRQHDIRLDADGSLTGRIRSLNPQTGQPVRIRRLNVFLVRDNEIIAQAPVSPLGVFTFPDLSEGLYSFVAAGTEGFTAFSIRTVRESVAGPDTPDELIVPVAFFQGGGFSGLMASINDVPYLLQLLQQLYGGGPGGPGGGPGGPAGFPGAGAGPGGPGPPGGGAGGGGFPGGGGGFAGGGGGFGGGEGLGALLGLAALGAAAAALADDDGNPPQIMSPAVIQ